MSVSPHSVSLGRGSASFVRCIDIAVTAVAAAGFFYSVFISCDLHATFALRNNEVDGVSFNNIATNGRVKIHRLAIFFIHRFIATSAVFFILSATKLLLLLDFLFHFTMCIFCVLSSPVFFLFFFGFVLLF